MTGRTAIDLDPVASIVERLAVLLAAGVAPASAWRHLAESPLEGGDDTARIVTTVSAADAGAAIGDAVLEALGTESRPGEDDGYRARRRGVGVGGVASVLVAWRALAAAWLVATDAGAPLAPSLREFAVSLRGFAQSQRDAQTALSGPVATARLVLVLPLVGVLFGMALGFDTLGTLVTTIPGLFCLLLGSALMVLARAWNRRLVSSASSTDVAPGLALDLLAIALSGGASLDRARSAVERTLERCGLGGGADEAAPVLELSRRAGVPAGALLRSEADRRRREARSIAERRAATLGVTLMMPLGLCVLPAFMLLGVAPLLIAVLSSTVGSL
jgi:tight adherence protein B